MKGSNKASVGKSYEGLQNLKLLLWLLRLICWNNTEHPRMFSLTSVTSQSRMCPTHPAVWVCVNDDRLRRWSSRPWAHQWCLLGHWSAQPGLRVVVVESCHHQGDPGLVSTFQSGEVIYQVIDNLDIFVVVLRLKQLALLILQQTNLSLRGQFGPKQQQHCFAIRFSEKLETLQISFSNSSDLRYLLIGSQITVSNLYLMTLQWPPNLSQSKQLLMRAFSWLYVNAAEKLREASRAWIKIVRLNNDELAELISRTAAPYE